MNIKKDASIEIVISPDKMKAFIRITEPVGGGNPVGIQEIAFEMKKKGVIFGIKEEMVRYIAENPIYNQSILIAEGKAPVHGINGKVKFLFNISQDIKPTIMDDGSVNYRELNYIENVRKDQKLCEITMPTAGVNGKTVLGTVVKAAEGKIPKVIRGANVYASGDNLSLYSSINGQVKYIDEKLSVFATHEVQANVDNSTGNINFIGSVYIRGNVLSGFTVEAGGDVEVFGVVEGATIKAGGNIILRRGMTGNNKGVLIAGGDIIANFIENSTAEAVNDIKAESIMHSNIKCGNRLELGGRKGLLVGGVTRVGKEIKAKVIGSHLATRTIIEVGLDPNLREKYKELRTEVINLEENVKKADQAINLLRRLEAANMLTEEKKEILNKSMRSKIYYESRLYECCEEVASLEEKLNMEAYGRIRVDNYIYNGVRVSIGSASMHIKETLQHSTLYKDGADIRVGAF
ncbi:MAG: DUF342 domain-containing protein [Clostridiaceae bacterium]|nr:DUF342 domain-containing protein [Clostridiaceae bacterium]